MRTYRNTNGRGGQYATPRLADQRPRKWHGAKF
jgi:hypothetical protein